MGVLRTGWGRKASTGLDIVDEAGTLLRYQAESLLLISFTIKFIQVPVYLPLLLLCLGTLYIESMTDEGCMSLWNQALCLIFGGGRRIWQRRRRRAWRFEAFQVAGGQHSKEGKNC